jgi:hypothetical protein
MGTTSHSFLWFDRPPVRCIFGEGKVGSGAAIIREVASQDVTQVALAEDDDVVETLAPNRADQAFGEGILPWTSSGREDLLDPHPLHALTEGVTVDRVSVAEDDLLSGPRRGGMLGNVIVQDLTPMVSEDDQGSFASRICSTPTSSCSAPSSSA